MNHDHSRGRHRWRWRSLASLALAQKKYGPGATDTEIKIGHTMPYSGPASAYGTIGKIEQRLLQDGQRARAASTAARSTSSA